MKKSPAKTSPHLRSSDMVAAIKLVTSATQGVTRITEQANQAVWSTLGMPSGVSRESTRGITGAVFKSITGITGLVGKGLELAFSNLIADDTAWEPDATVSEERDAVIAAFNGVLGDHLEATGNPLATAMQFRLDGKRVNPDQPGGSGAKLLLLIHGSSMNDRQWTTVIDGHSRNHGQALGERCGYSPIYLRYNSGRHISENGRELAGQLERLVQGWPEPVGELAMLAHSMGGLVARSAVHYAREAGLNWPAKLRKLAFLGTPHWGSPLERAGNWVDAILSSNPYWAPYAKLGKIRSAGVTDLRYGYLLDDDWRNADRFDRRPDLRPPLPLPDGVDCYTVAATLAAKRSLLADRLTGDGLVPLNSALGKHADAARSLAFPKSHQAIFYRCNHIDLLSMPEVAEQLVTWFSSPGHPAN